jgi:hypothetical protein|tara:strand:- start:1092 stop:1487 length:396 start_codon:yes stop_codon:yes gene_type:complete
MTRGLRNNNPGNIRKGIDWDGLSEDQDNDSSFAQFQTPEYGIRAMFKIMKTYRTKYDINTIEGIVTRWAPPLENDTEEYISFVETYTGLDRAEELEDNDMSDVVMSIIHMENGLQPYPLVVVQAGRALAYG